jgi:heme A synthase
MNGARTFAAAGLWGAALTVVIIAMSVLMRLGTRVEAGEALSLLPPAVEALARLAHRIAAMGVGVLAALAAVAASRERPVPRARMLAVAGVVVLTVVLAMVGRYTPGYRFDAVTAVNVAGGIALAAAFWAVRATATAPDAPGEPLAWIALALLLPMSALGALADAAAMRHEAASGSLHAWLAAPFAAATLAASWRGRQRRSTAAWAALLVPAQAAIGLVLLEWRSGARPIALAGAHALAACALALLLVSLARPGPARIPAGRAGDPRPGSRPRAA